MRKLTEEEISKEVEDIRKRSWPLESVLFMKNLYAEFKSGVIRRVDGEIVPTVLESPRVDENDPKHVFGSLEEMVRAGWVVD